MKVGLCIKGYSRILNILKDVLPEDEIFDCDRSEVVDAAKVAEVLIPTMAPIPEAALQSPKLKLVQQYGVGLDCVDIPVATQNGVLVANVPSVGTGNAESVAELAIAHMLMLSRHIPLAFERFGEKRIGMPLGQCLWKSTVAILGYGGIGEEIARRLEGFGARVVAISRNGPRGERPRDSSIHLDDHVGADQTESAVADADYVVVAAPASTENIGLVDESIFSSMKKGVFVVNIARGPVIDYTALRNALKEGRVAGAGLDVFWQEPFDPNDPIMEENIIPTPHIGGGTERSLRGIGEAVGANIERLKRGEIPTSCVNPEVGIS